MTAFRVVIPFKAAGHKSRLERRLGKIGARCFALCLLEDLLDVMKGAGPGQETALVTSDPEAERVGASRGILVVKEREDGGVDSAVRAALSTAGAEDVVLVLPSDLPYLTLGDVHAAAGMAAEGFTVICPSSEFNGTNALTLRRIDSGILSYDKDSFWNHLGNASKAGLRVAVITGRGLMFDVDTEGDFARLAGSGLVSRSANMAKQEVSKWPS